MVQRGDTFQLKNASIDSHLHIIISDPSLNPYRIVTVNFTSWRADKDHSCIVESNEHPFITHRSCIDYRREQLISLAVYEQVLESGDLIPYDPVSETLLKRILTGEMNVVTCPSCRARFHVEVPFLYHDMTKGEMIWVYPAARAAEGAKVAEDVRKKWDELKRSMPPEVRRTLDERYSTVKIVFGMDALVEHIMADVSPDRNPAAN